MLNRRVEESGHKFIQFVAGWILAILVCYLLFSTFYSALNSTEVRYSAVTKECVAVITAQGVVMPCEGNVPLRHNPVPVAPEITYQQIVDSFSR